jgi:hydroxyacylglutathione hydrolase
MPVRWIPGEGFFANTYLVGSVLVDAGITPIVVRQFRDLIETVVITHCHYDHIAHLSEIAAMCDASIAIHVADASCLNNPGENLSILFGERMPPIETTRLLKEGDRVGELEVIHTPGHTPGSICLYNKEDKTLISGDTVFADGGFGRVDFPGGSLKALRESVEKLAGLDVEGLYPGHGEPVGSGGSRHIEAARRVLMSIYG